jgi:hypothetical protein
MTPPADFSGRLALTVEASAAEANGTQAVTAEVLAVEIAAVADPPRLAVAAAAGREDAPVLLSIDAVLADADGSESLSLAISGLPEGASLTAGKETGDLVWHLRQEDLVGLALLPPVDFSGSLELVTEATAEEKAGDRAATRSTIAVDVAPVADPPLLSLDDAVGLAGEEMPLSIAVAGVDLDGSERLSVLIEGLPEGAYLSAGQDPGDRIWRLSSSDLVGLTLETPADLNGAFVLTVKAIAEEGEGAQAVTTDDLTIEISRKQEPAAFIADSAAAAASKLTEGLTEPVAAETADLSAVTGTQPQQDAVLAAGAEWVARGDQLLELGDIAAARLYYELAVNEGNEQAATAVAKTFDPRFLRDLGVLGNSGNPDKAAVWYQRGIDSGDVEALDRLSSLRQWLGQ